MANPEMQLISHIVAGLSSIDEVIEWGITDEDYKTAEGRAFFQALVAYKNNPETRGATLGPLAFRSVYPNFTPCHDESMTTAALCHEVRSRRLAMEAKEAAEIIIKTADLNPLAAATEALDKFSKIQSLASSRKTDVSFEAAFGRILHEYDQLKKGVVTSKAPWPWQLMNDLTGGIQKDDYVVLYGRGKSMKTWVLSWIMGHQYLCGKKALIYTKEMTPHNIYKRIAACVARVPYQELRMGKLSPQDEAAFFEAYEDVARYGKDRLMCLSGQDVKDGGDTVHWIQSKVKLYKPDICFIDGLYLLSDGKGGKNQDWQRVMNISRATRQMILTTEVPVVCTLQANRAAAKHQNAELDEIAYSDAVGQDATVAMRVINEKTGPTIALVLAGSREFQLHGFRIYGIPATDFTFKEEMSEKQITKAREDDATKDEPDSAGAHTAPRKRRPVVGQAAKDAQDKVLENLKHVDHHLKNL